MLFDTAVPVFQWCVRPAVRRVPAENEGGTGCLAITSIPRWETHLGSQNEPAAVLVPPHHWEENKLPKQIPVFISVNAGFDGGPEAINTISPPAHFQTTNPRTYTHGPCQTVFLSFSVVEQRGPSIRGSIGHKMGVKGCQWLFKVKRWWPGVTVYGRFDTWVCMNGWMVTRVVSKGFDTGTVHLVHLLLKRYTEQVWNWFHI